MSSSDRPRIAAVIVQYGDASPLPEALASLRASRDVEVEPVVVDNGPGEDGAVEAACREARAVLVRPGRNLGYAGGLEAGAAEVRRRGEPPLWLFLNHDVVLDPAAAALLAERLAASPSTAAIGPAIVEARDPGIVWNAGSRIEWPWARPRSDLGGRPAASLPGAPAEIGFACGCAVLVRAGPLAAAGGWDPSYFLYFEDADLSFRLRRAGWRVEVEPRARAIHRAGAAAEGAAPLAEYCRVRGRILFSRRWAPAGAGPAAARWLFALRRMARSGPSRRGALAGLRGRGGPPPEDLAAPPDRGRRLASPGRQD